MTTDYAKFTPITEDTKFELKLDENTSCIMTGGQIRAALTPSVEPKSEEECLRTLYENVKDDSMKAFLRTWFEPVECKPNEEHDKESKPMIEYLKKWLEEQKERFEDLMSNDSDSYSQGMCVGGKLVCADALELIEELEKVGDPAEEEKFFAKIFPKEDNDPIS